MARPPLNQVTLERNRLQSRFTSKKTILRPLSQDALATVVQGVLEEPEAILVRPVKTGSDRSRFLGSLFRYL